MPPQRHLPASTHPKVRQRSARACAPCRKRKIKCDGTDPCAACVGYGYDCVYNDPSPRKPSSTAAAASPSVPSMTTEISRPVLTGPLKNTEPFIASESLVECPYGDPLLLRALKTRFTSIHSAIAVPRKLGMSLDMPNPPRLQSFGWNPGARSEPKVARQGSLCSIISLDQMKQYSDIYFNEVHPYFGILEKDLYNIRSKEYWLEQRKGMDFEACMCGVVALGSYFSATPLPSEAEVVEHGKYLLDFSIARAPANLSIKHVLAWMLRAIYLRCTTRPHLSWMASCNAMHIAEAIGLHREINENPVVCDRVNGRQQIEPLEIDLRRRTFWVAVAFNQFLSSEYGRTRINLDMISCKPLQPRAEDFTVDVINIMISVPKSQDFTTANISELLQSLKRTTEIPVKDAFLGLLRADACFCIYRMLRCTNVNLPICRLTGLLDVIRVALDGVTFLSTMRQPWWNLIGTPFHSICVLLALGTSESFSMIPHALEILKNAAALYNSHLSNEALRTAHALVQGARDKRKQELESLDRGLDAVGDLPPDPSPQTSATDNASFFEDNMGGDIGGFLDFLDLSNYYGNEQDAFMLT
ncbi:hypothetical protein BDZ45DRAFT_593966 [Acephala macrosclerotiorum]|nr:hypothetical protein BDZ45DRAFT_593966 [Acephala macrosclerotiorum]